MDENPARDEVEINLLDYWYVLAKHKRILFFITGISFISSIIISLYLPKIYTATTSILPPQQEEIGMISKLPGGFSNLASGFLGKSSPVDLWLGILKSNSIRDSIIDRFDLMNVFNLSKRDEAQAYLAGTIRISKSKENIVSITVEDQDPERAAEIANAYVEELDQINQNIVTTSGRRMRIFVEERLKEASVELSRAEEAIKDFQETTRTIKLDTQSKAIIEAIGTIKGRLMAKEVQLKTLQSFATPTHPNVELLRTEVNELEESLRELLEGKKHPGNPSPEDIFIPTQKLPDLGLQFVRLMREAKIQETLFGLLTQQYEMARIQEAKDTPTIQVLDIATVPETRSKPKRKQIVILTTLIAAFFSVFLAFFIEYIQRMKSLAKNNVADNIYKELNMGK